MKYNPHTAGVDLIPHGWYLVKVTKGKSGITKEKGYERWALLYEILAVAEVGDAKNTEAAENCVGRNLPDSLIDMPEMEWNAGKWAMFLKAMFPENEGKNEDVDVHAEQCVGRQLYVKVGSKNGNPEYGEPEKVNTCRRYKVFKAEPEKKEDPLGGAF